MTSAFSQRIKEEFQASYFFLQHPCSGTFARSEWKAGPSALYLVWRAVWAGYHIGILGLSGYLTRFTVDNEANRVKILVYLTICSYIVLALAGVADLALSVYFYIYRKQDLRGAEAPMPWYCKALWVLANISNSMAFLVSLLYWVLIHDYEVGFQGYNYITFFTHGANLIYVVLNLLVTAMPVRLLHFYHVVIYGILYAIFNAVYVLAGGTNDQNDHYIYKFLDWNKNPGLSSAISLEAVVGTILFQGLSYNVRGKDTVTPINMSLKATMQEYLTSCNVDFRPSEAEDQLKEKISLNKKPVKYKEDVRAAQHGYVVLRMPVRHCELNPTEPVCANCKGGFMARHNKTIILIHVKGLINAAFAGITPEGWQKTTSCPEIERGYRQSDISVDIILVAPGIIPLGDRTDSHTFIS
ncbi:protein rolling stone-like [Haliotis rufescens]|uniref:protein rolling stone-like n=1 Tax=Haliotis rufescens TaxID=6454 RepID=UPI00201F0ABE|nr:protein rolling stone-like [Haliotis rufescens]